MTLLDLANYICGKVNQTETEDVLACRGFLTRRHDLVWQEALWKDALVEYRQTINPVVADYRVTDPYLPTKGVLLLPSIIQRVIAARTTSRKLNVQRAEFYYRMDCDAFARTGEAVEYLLLPPCVWEFNTAQVLFLARADAADAALQVAADVLDADGSGVTRQIVTLAEALNTVAITERLDALTKQSSTGTVSAGADRNPQYGANLASGSYSDLGGVPSLGFTLDEGTTYLYTAGNSTGLVEHYFSNPKIEEGLFVATGTDYFLTGATDGEVCTATIQEYTQPGNITPPVILTAGQTNAARRQRIRLMEIPTAETVIRVLGKRSAPSFSEDTDEPGIAGMENCLIAFGMADMLERDESYAEAREKFQEAVELVEQLKRIETAQQAHNQSITPESGYGDDFGLERPGGWMQ